MRKLLLFTFIISFLTVGSCSRDEGSNEVSLTEKEYLVKQTIIEFNNSAVKTGKYHEFINSVAQKSASEPISPERLEAMIQEFLGDQARAFLDVYYQLKALNLTSEEFRSIASQFEYLRINFEVDPSKSFGCCQFGGAGNSRLHDLLDFVCGCQAE
ncbi:MULTISPECIES: hypothetical protein [Aquimarina]|uniref:hypothetical protein n=1 Tax=Aquimarina TaxID=290174 RepID=UPI000D68DE67|nr:MULTISPECIES: hypothetical protein [Aquimarina]